MLPLPHEKPIVWDGEGKPPVGIVCKNVSIRLPMFIIKLKSMHMMVIL